MEYNRISELSQRANKCTNGKRYTIFELKNMGNKWYNVYYIYVSDKLITPDKFFDLGLVGTFRTDNSDKLDIFYVSCRVLRRNVENKMLEFYLRDQ